MSFITKLDKLMHMGCDDHKPVLAKRLHHLSPEFATPGIFVPIFSTIYCKALEDIREMVLHGDKEKHRH